MRRLVTLLASLSFAAGLTAAQTAYACDCGAHGDDPAAMGECPHAKDGKAKCEEGKDCKCAKDCACSKESKDCKCAQDGKDCKCGPECKCHSGGECAEPKKK